MHIKEQFMQEMYVVNLKKKKKTIPTLLLCNRENNFFLRVI